MKISIKTYRLIFILFFGASLSAQTDVWIDTDNGFGKLHRDVDDALAIISLLNTPSINIKGISLVRTVNYGYKSTKKIIDLFNETDSVIPIYKGANYAKQLGEETEASLALEKQLETSAVTLVILGGATNIATVLRKRPELAKNINQIIFCGGRQLDSLFKPGNGRFTFDDANFDFDPQSIKEILSFDIPFVFSGYEAATSVIINKSEIKELKQKSKWVYKKLNNWIKIWKNFLKVDGFMPFDAVTTAYLVSPSYCNCQENIPVLINTSKEDKHTLDVSVSFVSAKTVTYCTAINKEFKQFLLNQLLPKVTVSN